MYRKRLLRVIGLFVVLSMALGVFAPAFASPRLDLSSALKHSVSRQRLQSESLHVVYPERHDLSAPLISMKGHTLTPMEKEERAKVREIRLHPVPKALKAANQGGHGCDPNLVQSSMSPSAPAMPVPAASFDGIHNTYHVLPPDTNGDIGYDPDTGKKYYFQIVNLGYAVWDVTDPSTPTQVITPTLNNAMWSGFGGVCESHNDGDPIVLFDHLANRWLFSQFALDFDNNKFYQCIAVSATADPTGRWYRYSYEVPSDLMNDYPKFGVWRDAYYMTANQFDPRNNYSWAGAGVFAFERSAMLTGGTARMVYINVGAVTPDYGGMLPADLDGVAPPAGTPGYFVEWDDSSWIGDPQDTLRVWEFHVDWSNPSNSTFGANASYDPNYKVATSDVDPDMCGFSRNCIPQPGGTPLDAIADRLMYRLAFRVWDDGTFSMVSNHTVDVDGSDHAGIHWFELKWDGSTWSMTQEGVYAPDNNHRWMGSIAMDASHDMALGYSVSSTSVYPSVYFTGRLAGDPPGQMGMGPEGVFVSGGGSQGSSYGRWGDYSMMSVDPQDGCTFWYTQEYYPSDSNATWYTRIGSFKFNTCSTGPTGSLEGTVTEAGSGAPIAGAMVEIPDLGYSATSDENGHYAFSLLPTGTYTVTARKFGYEQVSALVDITENNTSTKDFTLTPKPRHDVTFHVSDNGGNWPLYAKVDISGDPEGPFYTNPKTGEVVVSVPEGSYLVTVHALTGGYIDGNDTRNITSDTEWDFALDADMESCSAPGYGFVGFSENFENWPLTGWTIVDNISGGGLVWNSNTAYGDGNYTGGIGLAADVNSDANNGVPYDTELVSPVIDVSSLSGLTLHYKANYQDVGSSDTLDLDISTDGGTTWSTLLHWTENHGSLYGLPGEDVSLDLTSAIGSASSFQLRWHYYTSDSSPWDWYAQIDEVRIGACQRLADGLIVGTVTDANTGQVLPQVTVEDGSGKHAVWVDASADPATPDSVFFLGEGAGSTTLQTTNVPFGYNPASATVTVNAQEVTWKVFALTAPQTSAAPDALSFQFPPVGTATITVSNTGTADAANVRVVAVKESTFTPPTTAPDLTPFSRANLPDTVLKHLDDLDARAVGLVVPPLDEKRPVDVKVGKVVASWDTGLAFAWGLGVHHDTGNVWVGDLSVMGGEDKDHEYTPDGTQTGRAIDLSSWVGVFAADMAYDPITRTFWQINVGGDNCIYELDPNAATPNPTGRKICPEFGLSLRGLAFDPTTNTFLAGTWNYGGYLFRIGMDGTILKMKKINLPISGLAFNPTTGHLFATLNVDTRNTGAFDVYVLDPQQDYAIVGAFNVHSEGSTTSVIPPNGQAAMGAGCDGNLWIVDQADNKVYRFQSGETGWCDWQPDWISISPDAFSLSAGGSHDVTVHADLTGKAPGEYHARLLVVANTPYDLVQRPQVNVTAKVAQADLSVSEDDDPDPVYLGDPLTYSIVVANNGPDDAVNVVLTGNLPAALQNLQYSTDGGATWHDWGGSLNLGDLANGHNAAVLLRGTVDPLSTPTTLTNTVTVTSDVYDARRTNNTVTEETRSVRASNDEPEHAEILGMPDSVVVNNIGSYTFKSTDPIPSCVTTWVKATSWYKVIPAENGVLGLDTYLSDFDSVIGVFTGAPGAFTEVACNNDVNGTVQSHLSLPVSAGTTYYIMVGSKEPNPSGSLHLHAATFADVTGDAWYWKYVEAVHSAGITSGYSDGTYGPGDAVSRAESTVFLLRAVHGGGYQPPHVPHSGFSDVADNYWAKDWIQAAADEGVVSGYPDGTFRPENAVTRAETSVLLLRAIHGGGYMPPHFTTYSFTDIPNHWAADWIEELHREGFSGGYPDGTYRPDNSVTRAEMATLLTFVFNLPTPGLTP